VLRTETGEVFFFPGSGTGAWEAAITNTLNPGDKVLMARFGQFSALWVEMAERSGSRRSVDVSLGRGHAGEGIRRILGADKHDEIKAVFVTHNETATGVTSDVAAVRRALDACFHDALLFVDGVSSVGLIDFRMDEWGVDLDRDRQPEGPDAARRPRHPRRQPQGDGRLETATMRRAYFEFADTPRSTPTATSPTPRRRSCSTACAPR
jgi:alanine-glyoxylate transaminase/serine-glyoxylate transaminase/serine-pyruvate transaminase